ARPPLPRRGERLRRRCARPRPRRAARDGPGLPRSNARAGARRRQGRPQARPRVVDFQALRDRAEPAPARADGGDPGAAGARLGGPGLCGRGAQDHARLAPLARQLDRGWHLGGPARHHRQTRARAARLMDLVLSEEQELLQHTAREFAAGERLRALAWQEPGSRYDPHHVETRAERAGGGWRLRGEKIQVLDGAAADRLVVSARTAGGARDVEGITLFVVRSDAPGVALERQVRVDSRGAALLHLADARVEPDAVLGQVGRGGPLLAPVLDRATVGLTAEMLGSMSAAFEMTIDYLKTR